MQEIAQTRICHMTHQLFSMLHAIKMLRFYKYIQTLKQKTLQIKFLMK